MNFYQEKTSKYFAIARTEIQPLLPEKAERVLEIGCADGSTLLWVREKLASSWLGGVELFEDAAEKARHRIDWVSHGNIETKDLPFEPDSLDMILCLDVLEHLWDPRIVDRKMSTLLKPGGVLIISIPNVRHHSVLKPLLFRGRWDYEVEGVLDKSHIRFFTKATAVELAQTGGLKVDIVTSTGLESGTKSALANALLLGVFTMFFERQYLVRAIKP